MTGVGGTAAACRPEIVRAVVVGKLPVAQPVVCQDVVLLGGARVVPDLLFHRFTRVQPDCQERSGKGGCGKAMHLARHHLLRAVIPLVPERVSQFQCDDILLVPGTPRRAGDAVEVVYRLAPAWDCLHQSRAPCILPTIPFSISVRLLPLIGMPVISLITR